MGTETIYVDLLNHCHRTNDGTMKAVQTYFFIGKCETFVEGYCYKITENGTYIYPWKPDDELDTAQREFERAMLAQKDETIAELDALVLNLQYNNLINN